jgi:hypothetical protein
MEDVAEHLALDVAEIADPRDFPFAAFDRFLDLVAQGGFAVVAEQQAAKPAPECAPVFPVAGTVVFHGV